MELRKFISTKIFYLNYFQHKNFPIYGMNCACLFYLDCGSEVAASPGKSLFGKALSCAVSVVKASHIQDGATTSCVQRQRSVFMAMNGPFWPADLLPFLSFEKIILPCLNSSILVVFAAGVYFKVSFVFLVSIIFCIWTR